MKTILLLSLLLVGCTREPIAGPQNYLTTITDERGVMNRVYLPDGSTASLAIGFVMGELNAVSNAIYHCKQPPEGWTIVCDGQSHYAAKNYIVCDETWDVRTNEYEAVVAAWRIKAIWDAQRETVHKYHANPKWHQCDEDLVFTNNPSAVYSNVLTNEPLNTNRGPLTNLAWWVTNFYTITNNGWFTNSKPFGEFINITTPTNYGDTYYGTDWDHPTNIEVIFYHEPVIVGHSNGIWVVHFKP